MRDCGIRVYKYDVWATYRVKTQGWLTVAKHGDRGQAGVILQVHHSSAVRYSSCFFSCKVIGPN